MLENLKQESKRIGKSDWRPLLAYVAQLHEKSIHPPVYHFPFPWEEIGPGYCYSPAFGHWDLVHQVLDVLPAEPEHAKNQLLNNLEAQEEDGLIPGSIWLKDGKIRWNKEVGHPPVWPEAVQAYCDQTGSNELISQCYEPLLRQIGWFNEKRKAEGEGYYYTDILNHSWESGVDDGVRFDNIATGPYACVDATSHVYNLYVYAAGWSRLLGKDEKVYSERAAALKSFINEKLFDEETGFFHDIWAIGQPSRRHMALEGIFPVVVGAATPKQANRVIDENLLSPQRFFTKHPLATVGVEDPLFELRMWRGPAWNSITYWAARGCIRYNRPDAAKLLLERALDMSAKQFEATGTIWEFYHPHGGNQLEVARKPYTKINNPCPDYLGHNPLIAMARMWESARG